MALYRKPFSFKVGNYTIPLNSGSYAGSYMRNMYRQGTKFARSVIRNKNRRSGRGIETTAQRDYKVQYVRKRAPKKVRRIAKKAYKRFIRQSLKLVGSNTIVKNDAVENVVGTGSSQSYVAVTVAGTNGTNAAGMCGNNDLNAIASADTRFSTSGKMLLKTAYMDITARNTGQTNLEVDCYELAYSDLTKETGPFALISSAQTTTPAIGALTSIALTNRGVQLFDFPALFKFGVKIIKKTKVFLPIGQTFTYNLSQNKPTWISMANDLTDNQGYVKKGLTKTVVFVFKPTITESGGQLYVGATRKYFYKIFEDDSDRDGLLP